MFLVGRSPRRGRGDTRCTPTLSTLSHRLLGSDTAGHGWLGTKQCQILKRFEAQLKSQRQVTVKSFLTRMRDRARALLTVRQSCSCVAILVVQLRNSQRAATKRTAIQNYAWSKRVTQTASNCLIKIGQWLVDRNSQEDKSVLMTMIK